MNIPKSFLIAATVAVVAPITIAAVFSIKSNGGASVERIEASPINVTNTLIIYQPNGQQYYRYPDGSTQHIPTKYDFIVDGPLDITSSATSITVHSESEPVVTHTTNGWEVRFKE